MFCFGGVEAFSPFLLQCFLFIGVAMKGQNLSLSLNWGNGLPSPHVGHITTRWAPSRSLVHGVPLYMAENKWETVVKTDPEIRGAIGPLLITGRGPSFKEKHVDSALNTNPSSPLGPLFAGELFVYNIGFLATLRRFLNVTIFVTLPRFLNTTEFLISRL